VADFLPVGGSIWLREHECEGGPCRVPRFWDVSGGSEIATHLLVAELISDEPLLLSSVYDPRTMRSAGRFFWHWPETSGVLVGGFCLSSAWRLPSHRPLFMIIFIFHV
jgi:hypothetical protein